MPSIETSADPYPTATFGGHTYCLYPVGELLEDMDPESFCESKGGHLATLTSTDENDFVAEFVTRNGHNNCGLWADL